jgi:hypothetical protein
VREQTASTRAKIMLCCALVSNAAIAQTFIARQPSGAPLTVETGSDNGFLACAVSALNAELQHGTADQAFSGLMARASAQSQAIISGHGSPGSICTGNGNRCVFTAMTRFNESGMQGWGVSADKISGKFASLMLLSCDTGAEVQGAKFLHRIATHVHVPVSAPTYLVWCGNGQVWIDKDSDIQTATDDAEPATKPKPRFVLPIATVYKLRVASGWALVPVSQVEVEQFGYSHYVGRSLRAVKGEGATDLSLKIDFANPFQPGGVPAAVTTGTVVLNIRARDFSARRTFTIYTDDVAQDDQFPDTFYRIDSTLSGVMDALRQK